MLTPSRPLVRRRAGGRKGVHLDSRYEGGIEGGGKGEKPAHLDSRYVD